LSTASTANGVGKGGQVSISFDDKATRMRRFSSADGYEVAELVTADGAHRMHGAQAIYDLTQVLTGYPLPPSKFDARQEVWQFLMNSLSRNSSRRQAETSPQITRASILRSSKLIDDQILDFGRTSTAFLDDKFAAIYRAARRSIGRVSSDSSSSTGFVVSNDGVFLATDHAVFDGQSQVSLPTGVYKANLLARERKSDLALLKLESNKPGEVFEPLRISQRRARLGEKALAAGFPVFDELVPPYRAMSGRLFTHNSEFGDSLVHAGTRWDGYFIRSKEGASGSPVMDKTGAVTGIVSFHRRFGDGAIQFNTTGAIGAPTIRRFISDYVSL
jgi:S1-C subfamily serine protease